MKAAYLACMVLLALPLPGCHGLRIRYEEDEHWLKGPRGLRWAWCIVHLQPLDFQQVRRGSATLQVTLVLENVSDQKLEVVPEEVQLLDGRRRPLALVASGPRKAGRDWDVPVGTTRSFRFEFRLPAEGENDARSVRDLILRWMARRGEEVGEASSRFVQEYPVDTGDGC